MNWLTGIFRRRQLYDELSEEIRLHLDERTEQLMREGMSRRQAEEAARRAFGNATLLEERSREVWIAASLALLLAATFPAAFLPAYRASNTDPMRVLREQ
jgi:ABC-type antimicrobial peptide transport system permease subunit